jgi:transposase
VRRHRQRSIEEKNQHVKDYLAGKRVSEILRELDLEKSVFRRWVSQYRKHGTTVDGRGKAKSPGKGRPRNLNPDLMNIEELREYVRLLEDIKKAVAFLRRQKKNTKS